MRLSPTVLSNRVRAVADRLARGSAVPAGTDPDEQEAAARRPSSRERGAIRRRLRQQRKLRDALLMELGALVMEAHRHGRDDAGVVKSKAAEAAAADAEVVALAETLEDGGDLARLTATGLAAPCQACGTLVSTRARFCERCGADLSARPAAATEPAAATDVGAGDEAFDGAAAAGEHRVDEPAAPNGDGADRTEVLEPVEPAGNGDEPVDAASEHEPTR